MKQCTKCKRLLDENEFHKDKTRRDGLSYTCKECRKQYAYAYPLKWKSYRDSHREQRRAYQAKYDIENREEKRCRVREWQKRNPEKCRAKSHRRRAKVANLPRDLTPSEWQEILEQFDHRCAYCGTRPSKLQQEHVIPVQQGGGYTKSNIVPACPPCNFRKGNRTPKEANMKLICGQARP